ncbi:hypothetical protein NECAME_10288 [Necator americanus]|uniref:Uncharacterized protein n=1 Tax=Necator americanus TaxID=51031 RepID=W2TAD2_NECAM|nr:hypothetical protein NECAME_10288 [Necator americanus]ETN78554.1 hypothetical protein NECAME_10288 [Necator americanus]
MVFFLAPLAGGNSIWRLGHWERPAIGKKCIHRFAQASRKREDLKARESERPSSPAALTCT